MNTKSRKVLPVVLALVAILAFGSFQVFAAWVNENGKTTAPVSSSSSTSSDDRLSSNQERNEDFSFAGKIEANQGNLFTIAGKQVMVNANSAVSKGLMVGS